MYEGRNFKGVGLGGGGEVISYPQGKYVRGEYVSEGMAGRKCPRGNMISYLFPFSRTSQGSCRAWRKNVKVEETLSMKDDWIREEKEKMCKILLYIRTKEKYTSELFYFSLYSYHDAGNSLMSYLERSQYPLDTGYDKRKDVIVLEVILQVEAVRAK